MKSMKNCTEMISYLESNDTKILSINSQLDDIVYDIIVRCNDYKEQEKFECVMSDAGYTQIGMPFIVADDECTIFTAHYKFMWKADFRIVL